MTLESGWRLASQSLANSVIVLARSEALSVNEEYQSTNGELLASKEELQSLNEELNALNSQVTGKPSKNIAADLGISQRTVENHRASIMKRTGSKSLPALARLAVLASAGREETRQTH